MSTPQPSIPHTDRYARVIDISRRARWEIERDVIRGRGFDASRPFLPDGLSLARELEFLTPADRRLFSQVQGRTYVNLFGLVERFISAKLLQLGASHALGDQVALEALVGMTDEELKHQALFRRLDEMLAATMPPGYALVPDADAVASVVLGKSTWAVLALTLDIELFTQAHYRASIEQRHDLCPLWKDVFLFHWREEAQHAVLDELELLREDARLAAAERSAALEDLIALVGALDGILQAQADADARYFLRHAATRFAPGDLARVAPQMLKAYRWQYIVSGVMEPRFQRVLFALLDDAQGARLHAALAPFMSCVPAAPEMALPLAA
ncbi:hypothetical protein [Caenimonas aquaedulcis]|uniref:Ferritin-like domain-containing protein n=1 Tax=Caenimonas aquaedulcis TaxID=2793270 RepID=A0A931H890_9BURK|nr:hypothetical protein [Caenimonas aquaedulcis]MBG9390520.1 hypothetical protein [Caenimonas aquaedulcis]